MLPGILDPLLADKAYQAGAIVGALIAGVLSGSIVLAVGRSRGQEVLGLIGFVVCIPCGLVMGLLLALPVAGLFSLFILVLSSSGSSDRNSYAGYPELEDDDDRPRRRRKRARAESRFDDDEEDRPRKRRRDDDEDEDDRPRRRRDEDDERDESPRRRRY